MTINFINNDTDKNRGKSVIKTGVASYTTLDVEKSFFQKDFTVEENVLRGYSNSFATGTGVAVNTGGVVVFDADIFGGSLVDVTVINDGPSPIYVGFNNDGMSVSSGSELASGMPIGIDSIVNKIWAITSSGTSSISVHGVTNYNQNTI